MLCGKRTGFYMIDIGDVDVFYKCHSNLVRWLESQRDPFLKERGFKYLCKFKEALSRKPSKLKLHGMEILTDEGTCFGHHSPGINYKLTGSNVIKLAFNSL